MSETQKGGQLVGGSATAEALASSDTVFTRNYGVGSTKGLQQYFTPPEVAAFVQMTLGADATVLDPTAGDGSLLRFFPAARRFGVELDQDQIANAKEKGRPYHAIAGDLQHVYPLLKRVGPSWKTIVANPPFGLSWSDPTYKDGASTNSALLTMVYIGRLLDPNGQFAFIAGRDKFYKDISRQEAASGVYFTVDILDLFHNATLPAVVAFGVHPTNRNPDFESVRVETTVADFVDDRKARELQRQIRDARASAGKRYVGGFDANYVQAVEQFTAIQREYSRRTDERVQTREFDVDLFGSSSLNVQLSAFAALALKERRGEIAALHNQSATYFSHNERLWQTIVDLADEGILRVNPRVVAFVDDYLVEARREICPLYPLKPQQRLGFLTDIDQIKCRRSDESKGYVAGESYPIYTRSQTVETESERPVQIKSGKKAGEWTVAKFTKSRKALRISIGDNSFIDDELTGTTDIAYIVEHFDVPDPGDVSTRFPEDYARALAIVDEINTTIIEPNSAAYALARPDKAAASMRRFQIEDLARMGTKGSGLLGWEQGLGKTLGGGVWATLCHKLWGAPDQALFVVPQDLIPQWQEDIRRFFGRELELVKTQAEARDVKRRMKRGERGWFITYYEALSTIGTVSEMLPTVRMNERSETTWNEVAQESETVVTFIDSSEFCPRCGADARSGWNGRTCTNTISGGLERTDVWLLERQGESKLVTKSWKGDPDDRGCGYSHYKRRLKPMASFLTTAFRHGTVVVDEGTMIKSDEALRALAVRALSCKHPMVATGTPIKNFIPDAFWLLWYALGNGSRRFPYSYDGGKTKFENDFAVIEHKRDSTTHQKKNRKVLPEVTNLSMLWRLLCSSIIRRLQTETGEPLMTMRFHEVEVPLGAAQAQMQRGWAQWFEDYFTEMNPDHALVQYGMVGVWAPMIGLQQKLDYAATIPEADPALPWLQATHQRRTVSPELPEGLELDVSNWTPANLKTLELAMGLVKQGRKVLVGSNLKATTQWLTEQLQAKGVRAMHLLDGSGNTAPPAKRSALVQKFQRGNVQVLVAGIKAVRLGHNLDAGSAVIVHGLEWDHESFQQFIKRVHRLTSPKSIDVYVVLPKNTLTVERWSRLGQKADAADLALDGRLTEKQEERVNEADVVREFIQRGMKAEGSVPEQQVHKHWRSMVPTIGLFRPWPELLGETGDDHPTADQINGGWTPARPKDPSDEFDIVDVETVSVKVGDLAVKVPVEPPQDRFFDTSGNGLLFVESDEGESGAQDGWLTLFDAEEVAA